VRTTADGSSGRPGAAGPGWLGALAGALALAAVVAALALAVGDQPAVGVERGLARGARGLPGWVADLTWPPMQLGTVEAGWVVAAVVALALGIGPGLRVLASVLVVAQLSPALKDLVDRPRLTPDALGAMPLEIVRSPAYPSSHAAIAFAIATSIALVHRRAGAVALTLAVVVAFGRMVAGVHTAADLVGGAALGAAVALVVHAGASALHAGVARRR
jgi:membrane-associated phospholipid phosphatase